ncbi:CRISPR-associated RAMP protein Csx7 [Acidianus sp. HS-5]|uniref:type III CRISPR-associated RAMP protein Csx7 n=1 Tax=Acidianus sp. HS-5 TaxID=2886040 RepID=UPI001EFFFAB4|nr:CRISPR-associated RAMP protein Csx7 [Acidianus sp. HS-5]BDC17508.1 CRISPR-associated RAMP protein [Acidianus sp. HS-5]
MTFLHEELIRRVEIKGVVRNDSPIRVGSRDTVDFTSTARVQLLKNSSGVPYIPGSTWKGVFRSTGEAIARKRGLYTCTGLTRETCVDKIPNFQDIISSNVEEAKKLFWEKTCINCKVFGAQSVISAVYFFDSYPLDYKIGVKTIIAVSRENGAVAKGALGTAEYIEPNSTFTFLMLGENLPNYAIGYILSIMKALHGGVYQVGGYKSRGFGFVNFAKVELRVSHYTEKSGSGNSLSPLDDFDLKADYTPGEMNGDEFFNKNSSLIEVFNHAGIKYPM